MTFAVWREPPASPTSATRPTRGSERPCSTRDSPSDQLLRGEQVDHHGEHYHVKARLLPGPEQRPRPPIGWPAIVPHQRPYSRARRWEGVAPIGGRELLTREGHSRHTWATRLCPDGWDVVVSKAPEHTAQEYADAGATWLVRVRVADRGRLDGRPDSAREGRATALTPESPATMAG